VALHQLAEHAHLGVRAERDALRFTIGFHGAAAFFGARARGDEQLPAAHAAEVKALVLQELAKDGALAFVSHALVAAQMHVDAENLVIGEVLAR